MTITLETARSLATGHGKVYDATGNKIGSIGQVYVDDETGEPNWVTVKTGLFGLSESFAPLEGARADGVDLHVAASEDQVKAAPRVDPDGSLTSTEEQRLYSYYSSLDRSDQSSSRDDVVGRSTDREARQPGDDDGRGADDSERQATGAEPTTVGDRFGSEDDQHRTSAGQDAAALGAQRLRLRKYVVTEEATVTVPVQREEIRLEPEPGDRGTSDNLGPADRGDR